MRWIPVVLVITILAAGCAPTIEQQRSARLEALQLELEGTLDAWKTDVKLGRFGTSANAARALVSRYDAVYERWGLRADSLTQAMLAYASAVAVRVDAKELSAEEANALLQKMRADLDRAGDEPLMLARRLDGVAVLVSSSRYLAGRLAEHTEPRTRDAGERLGEKLQRRPAVTQPLLQPALATCLEQLDGRGSGPGPVVQDADRLWGGQGHPAQVAPGGHGPDEHPGVGVMLHSTLVMCGLRTVRFSLVPAPRTVTLRQTAFSR